MTRPSLGVTEQQDAPSMAVLTSGDGMYPTALPGRLGATAPETIYLVGDPALLQCSATAWFTSERLPAELIIPTLELARQFRDEGVAVISGFHSRVERECLDLLLRGDQPVLVCLARGMSVVRLPKEWRLPVESGRMVVVTAHPPRVRRPSVKSAEVRNRLAAGLAERVFIAGATPGGRLHALAREVAARRQPLACFDHPGNHDLLLLGASAVPPE